MSDEQTHRPAEAALLATLRELLARKARIELGELAGVSGVRGEHWFVAGENILLLPLASGAAIDVLAAMTQASECHFEVRYSGRPKKPRLVAAVLKRGRGPRGAAGGQKNCFATKTPIGRSMGRRRVRR
jgi:hypothetical protein